MKKYRAFRVLNVKWLNVDDGSLFGYTVFIQNRTNPEVVNVKFTIV
jgi:hypothetical protein